MKTFLHVGCGHYRKETMTRTAFNTPEWSEVRFDIDPNVQPDIIGSLLDMSSVPSGSFDALYSSHNVEHFYKHEVPTVLREFKRVLAPHGYAIITCPDLQSACALVAEDKLTIPCGMTQAGLIAPIDIIFGLSPKQAGGNPYMSHRCGFTLSTLLDALRDAGFGMVAGIQRPQAFELWVVATCEHVTEEEIWALAREHFPMA